jgi:hypothetical protein
MFKSQVEISLIFEKEMSNILANEEWKKIKYINFEKTLIHINLPII